MWAYIQHICKHIYLYIQRKINSIALSFHFSSIFSLLVLFLFPLDSLSLAHYFSSRLNVPVIVFVCKAMFVSVCFSTCNWAYDLYISFYIFMSIHESKAVKVSYLSAKLHFKRYFKKGRPLQDNLVER